MLLEISKPLVHISAFHFKIMIIIVGTYSNVLHVTTQFVNLKREFTQRQLFEVSNDKIYKCSYIQ